MTRAASARAAVGSLWLILAVTASWWALALWPVGSDAPDWFVRTREVCFGATADTLPTAGGWLLLVGQPVGMVALLAAVWGRDLKAGIALSLARASGQVAIGIVLALLVAGVVGVAARVRGADREPFSVGAADLASRLTRVNDVAPPLALVDQTGREITLASFRGRPVLVTFAFAHCQTVCPLIVSDVLAARARFADDPPAVLLVTLDPWRDTPSRLPSMARQWGLGEGAHVLSGEPEVVERTLNAWRVPRARNEKTGDISHPSIVYVVGADGRITYVVTGQVDTIEAALRAL